MNYVEQAIRDAVEKGYSPIYEDIPLDPRDIPYNEAGFGHWYTITYELPKKRRV